MFSARHQNSLFSAKARRYCDLYMESVESLLHYSPQHRFYPYEIINSPHQSAHENSDLFFSSVEQQTIIWKGVDKALGLVEDEELLDDEFNGDDDGTDAAK